MIDKTKAPPAKRNTDPLLLTPGPLTTSASVKQAMLRDLGSRDSRFIDITVEVCRKIEGLAGRLNDTPSPVCVPIQGSGTFAVEAAVISLIPRDAKSLILVNGAYGRRIVEICRYHDRACEVYEVDEDQVHDPGAIADILNENSDIRWVIGVHCETTSGILNPMQRIAESVSGQGRKFMLDAMSTFGAIDIDMAALPVDAVIASANKCLQGVPGLGFVLADAELLDSAEGNAGVLSLDLHAQWQYLRKSGQWRFTPPTHVVLALLQALNELEEEGGVAARGARYMENCRVLSDGMRELGFQPYLESRLQAPIIVTFREPEDDSYDFEEFYRRLHEKGFAIYPGKLTKAPSFRIGCIGDFGPVEMARAVSAIGRTCREMGLDLDLGRLQQGGARVQSSGR